MQMYNEGCTYKENLSEERQPCALVTINLGNNQHVHCWAVIILCRAVWVGGWDDEGHGLHCSTSHQYLVLSENLQAVRPGRMRLCIFTPHLYSELLYTHIFSSTFSSVVEIKQYGLETPEMKIGPDNLSVSGSFVKPKFNKCEGPAQLAAWAEENINNLQFLIYEQQKKC